MHGNENIFEDEPEKSSKHWRIEVSYDSAKHRRKPMSPSYGPTVKLSFRRQRGAYQFQHFVTGYKVWADLSVYAFEFVTLGGFFELMIYSGKSVTIRTYKSSWRERGAEEYNLTGRLQLWQRKTHRRSEADNYQYSSSILSRTETNRTASTNYSHATNATSSSQKTLTTYKTAQSASDGSIRLENPYPPFVVLLVYDSGGDPSLKKHDVFAIKCKLFFSLRTTEDVLTRCQMIRNPR